MHSGMLIPDRSGVLNPPPRFYRGTHCCEPRNPRISLPPPKPCNASPRLLARVASYLVGGLRSVGDHMAAFPEDFSPGDNTRSLVRIHADVVMEVKYHLLGCDPCLSTTTSHLRRAPLVV